MTEADLAKALVIFFTVPSLVPILALGHATHIADETVLMTTTAGQPAAALPGNETP